MHSPFSIDELVSSTELGTNAVTAALFHRDRIHLGTDKGSLLVFELEHASTSRAPPSAKLVLEHPALSQRPIEQLVALDEIGAIACLAGGDLTIHSLPSFTLRSSFKQLTRATCSSIARTTYTTSASITKQQDVHTLVALACRRRLILLSWNGTSADAVVSNKEIALPHQVRGMSFTEDQGETATNLKLVLGFSTGEYGVVTLPKAKHSAESGSESTGKSKIRKPPPGSATASSSTTGKPDQPVLGELFTPTSAGGSAKDVAPTLPSATAASATEGVKSSALGSLGRGALSLSALTTRKIDKNQVVSMPRKRRKAKRDASEAESEEEERRRTEEWLYGKAWGWDDQEGGKRVASKVLVVRENLGQVLDTSNGQASRISLGSITYPSPVEGTIVTPPFVVSLLSNSTLSIHTSDALTPVQTLDLAGQSSSSIVSNPSASKISISAKLVTLSSCSSPPLLVLTTSLASAATAGATGVIVSQTLSIVRMQSWTEQIESLGTQGLWSTAIRLFRLALPFSEPMSQQLSKETVKRLKLLRSWELFKEGRFGLAVDAFIRLEVSAVKVVGLYPEQIAGRLVRGDVEKEEAFGGRKIEDVRTEEEAKPIEAEAKTTSDPVDSSTPSPSHQHFLLAARLRESTIGSSSATPSSPASTTRSSSVDSARLGANSSDEAQKKAFNLSVDELVRFLTDRRQQINKALSLLPQSRRPLSLQLAPQATKEELDAILDGPVAELSVVHLARLAQVVDTALFKSYLATKPVMVGPLCRIENWCEVEEVEEALLEKKKYRELLDLYNGKSLHQKAVKLLRRIAEDEDAFDEKVDPTIRYVQKLGPAHLPTILEASEWVFATNRDKGLEIFLADLEEVEALPRHEVMKHLEYIGEDACMRYLEHVVHELDERGAEFHEKLVEIYSKRVFEGEQDGVGDEEDYEKLLAFLEASESYRADRMLGRLPASTSTSTPGTTSTMTKKDEALALVRALLLGRLGRHEGALQIYVYQLAAPGLAEDYCRRGVATEEDIFHVLLRIYLRPRDDQKVMFEPALEVIKKYALYLDPIVVFDLLPPLVSVGDLKVFLEKTLRRSVQAKNDRLVLKGITKSLSEKEDREKVGLEERRVKIMEGRVCPVCGKKLGNSVLAIFLPRGEVGHYQCREAFQERRKDL